MDKWEIGVENKYNFQKIDIIIIQLRYYIRNIVFLGLVSRVIVFY